MNSTPLNNHARRFLAAVQGIQARHVAAALTSMLCGATLPLHSRVHWSGCSKGTMAREYGKAMEPRANEADGCSASLGRLDLATLARRARACAEGQAGWAHIGAHGSTAATPAPTTAEIAAEVFKAPMLALLRQEVHDVSRSLLRTEDRLRAAEQRLKLAQEHNDALLALVGQAAVPGGISKHELTRPGGWLERAQRALAVAPGA